MADKRIQDLTPATSVQTNDLFVLEQSGAAKSLSGRILINDLATYLDGHGGISDIVYTPPVAPSLDGTLTITMADETVYSVTVKNGNGITSIVVSYGISNNGTDPTTVQSWGSTATPPTNQYPYGWTRIRLNQTTGVYTDSYSVTVKADDPTVSVGTVSAQPGLNASASITNTGTANDPVLNFSFELPQGDKGDTGDYIVPVVSYGTSTAAATEPSTWYNDPSSISYAAGNYIWRKTEYTLHDAQTVRDTVKEIIGYIGANGGGSGTVTQITFNGDVFADDGTGNVTMTVDAEDVGAIADPTTKSNGQVLTYDSTADEWVAANPSVQSVNGQTGAVTIPLATEGSNYCKMPDGTLIQWGEEQNKSTQAQIAFSKTYASRPTVFLTPVYNYQRTVRCTLGAVATTTGFTLWAYDTDTQNWSTSTDLWFYWVAVGRWK